MNLEYWVCSWFLTWTFHMWVGECSRFRQTFLRAARGSDSLIPQNNERHTCMIFCHVNRLQIRPYYDRHLPSILQVIIFSWSASSTCMHVMCDICVFLRSLILSHNKNEQIGKADVHHGFQCTESFPSLSKYMNLWSELTLVLVLVLFGGSTGSPSRDHSAWIF